MLKRRRRILYRYVTAGGCSRGARNAPFFFFRPKRHYTSGNSLRVKNETRRPYKILATNNDNGEVGSFALNVFPCVLDRTFRTPINFHRLTKPYANGPRLLYAGVHTSGDDRRCRPDPEITTYDGINVAVATRHLRYRPDTAV